MNVLVLEDERTDFILVKYAIEQLDVPCTIHHAAGLHEAHRQMKCLAVDLAVVDILLPDGDGFKMAEYLQEKEVPYVMVSTRTLPEDAIHGLKAGAEDYIRKPFDVDELSARLERVLLRFQRTPKTSAQNLAQEILGTLKLSDTPLTPTEEQLLTYLGLQKEHFVPTDTLIEKVWGDFNRESSKGALRTYISHIRKKLEQCKSPYIIVSKWGRGYQLTRQNGAS